MRPISAAMGLSAPARLTKIVFSAAVIKRNRFERTCVRPPGSAGGGQRSPRSWSTIVQNSIDLNRIPLLVGVTGHRDIAAEDEGTLRAAFGSTLQDIADDIPDTPL